jgi:hypothetical protein
MKAITLSLAFEVVSGLALTQGAADPMVHLRACASMEHAERLECLDKLARDIAAPERAAGGDNNWIISETTSPVNYAPMVTATASSLGGSDGSSMKLAIYCRGGRTELVVSGPVVSPSSSNFTISYRVNDDQPVQIPAGLPSFGTGAALTGDIVRLLQSLPEEAHIAVRLSARSGAAQEGHFGLGGLKAAREKLAAACRWPHSIAGPHH